MHVPYSLSLKNQPCDNDITTPTPHFGAHHFAVLRDTREEVHKQLIFPAPSFLNELQRRNDKRHATSSTACLTKDSFTSTKRW